MNSKNAKRARRAMTRIYRSYGTDLAAARIAARVLGPHIPSDSHPLEMAGWLNVALLDRQDWLNHRSDPDPQTTPRLF